MQGSEISVEREARQRLPELLADLLDEPWVDVRVPGGPADGGADLLALDDRGRQWLIEVKASSRPGQVDRAGEQLRAYSRDFPDAIPVLVVPHMSSAGAKAAARAGVNWLDLAGNAHIRAENLLLHVEGRPSPFPTRGRPSSPFAPKSARISRTMLLDPSRWWRQRDLVEATELDDGNVSRVVRRLEDEFLLERRELEFRPRDPDLLLDAWAGEYRFDRHDVLLCHMTGDGIALARELSERLTSERIHHAFTGLPAAWAIDQFAAFRLTTVYVDEDPRQVAGRLELRKAARGGNIQLVAPNDEGVFAGEHERNGLPRVSAVQVYLDLLHLPERAREAAEHLRARNLRWQRGGR
jgi:hypothetical protein